MPNWFGKRKPPKLGKDDLAEPEVEEAADEILALSREKALTESERRRLVAEDVETTRKADEDEAFDQDTTGIIDLAVERLKFSKRVAREGETTTRELRRSLTPSKAFPAQGDDIPPPKKRARSTFEAFYRYNAKVTEG